ncbi:type II secretion system ATPase GspE [Brevundimonas sp. 2R-24]|uniref:Type II secretion system protein E n=1 Tax=Peiella sedimenti TaxID=3061083 RepID=A0ABT8SJ25_9CAUL|nr:type II secretion system ATPase GspE [Caulobacteraceae bacterium XZ-24]
MQAAPRIAYGFAKSRGVVLLDWAEPARVGLREGADASALLEVRRALGRALKVEPLAPAAFDRRLSEVYADGGLSDAPLEGLDDRFGLTDEMPAVDDLLDAQDDAPIIRLINGLMAEAVRSGASDIHIEPYETRLVVRMRIDGVLRETLTLPARLAPLVVSRVKVMARLDIAERRKPQDGRIAVALGGKTVDVRVSTLPSRAGERVVMRVLDKAQADLSLDELGMGPETLAHIRRALDEPNGVILVTGPTGSGKTTTLYAALARLNDGRRNILTIEDPVEYAVDGVGQTQVNAKVGMTFAAGLRAILRQDPDVVMVGEIRDVETAQIAVQAALTGHLVLSTVHTNDAAGAVTRLRDMGVEPFLLASTLRLILAQRLVRRLCPECVRTAPATPAEAKLLGLRKGFPIGHAAGCGVCRNTGYQGRIGLYEAVYVDEAVRGLIASGADEGEIVKAALTPIGGLSEAGRAAVAEGLTTVEEALRVTRRGAQDDDHGEL